MANLKSSSNSVRKHLFINGENIETENYSSLYSPYSGELIAEIAIGGEKETKNAVTAAYEAKEVMANMPAYQRSEILENVARIIKDRAEEVAKVISTESAKPIMFARAEVARTIETYKFAAEEAKRIHGETIPFDAAVNGVGRTGYTVREPLGVIGAITPFNFPLNLVAHKVGPAIAAGNTVVLKPASKTPLSALLIAEIFAESGLPAGVLNVITGPGGVVGEALIEDERVKMITFTGSPSVGIGISNKSGLKKTTLELGSNSALIIDKDVEIEEIIDRCTMGSFSNQGQVCISIQRIFILEEKYEEFITKFVAATNELKLGDPLDSETYISSLISKSDLDRALTWIKEAEQGNAKIVAGGKVQDNILQPTIIVNAHDKLKVSCQEVFAPIVIVNKVKTVEEAVELVNDSRFGLQAGIYTNNVKNAFYATKNLQVGGVIVNDVPTFRVDQMPYGGVKESGTGREGVKYAIEEMMEMKLIVWNQG